MIKNKESNYFLSNLICSVSQHQDWGLDQAATYCVCLKGLYFPDVYAEHKYYNGSIQEEEYEMKLLVIIYVN